MNYFDIKNVCPDGYTDVYPDTTPEKEGYDCYSASEGTTLAAGSKILVVDGYHIEDIITVKDTAVIKEYDASNCFVSIECGDEMVLVQQEASILDPNEIEDCYESPDAIRKEGFDLIILHM